MLIKYAALRRSCSILTVMFGGLFLAARHLPGNRARHLRLRLHLRLHPGKGLGHLFSLWLRWGRLAMLARGGPGSAPALLLRSSYRLLEPCARLGVILGRAD